MKPTRIISIVLLLLTIPAASLHADRTLRGKLRPSNAAAVKVDSISPAVAFDTIQNPAAALVKLSGYDKPLTSKVESMFVTNHFDRDLTELTITLIYRDLKGRTLHETTRRIRADIPKGSTRRIQFKSWDSQNSFYYRHSRRPRTANVTPYDVSCQVKSCVLHPDTATD